jgi:hypothetical protein
MNDAITGVIRTAVTTGVGAFFAWLLTHNIEIDPDAQKALTVGVTAVVIAFYYLIVRLVEPHLPTWLRVILAGVPKTPTYKPLPESAARQGFSEPSPN